MNKPYPVGTRIKYIGHCQKCKGKTGKIVKTDGYNCYIALPQSTCSTFIDFGKAICSWNDVELLPQKNVQLEFAFMEEDLTKG